MNSKQNRRALAPRRHDEILRRLGAAGTVSIAELASFFDVSRETIRRDMKQLADQGRLDLVHGGARSFAATEAAPPLRSQENAAGKAAIGRAAAALVEDGMVVFLDTGTSALSVANELIEKKNLTVITTGLTIATLLCQQPGLRVHILGGEIDPQEQAVFGIDAVEAIGRFRIDMAFLGVGGVAPDGTITDFTRDGAEQRARIVAHAAQTYFLTDSSKFGRLTPMRVQGSDRAAGLIVDALPPPALTRMLQSRGINIIQA